MLPVVITGRHRPHEVGFLVFSALFGAAFLAGVRPPSSLEQLFPTWLLWAWYLLLLASGVIGLVGISRRDPYRALVLERAAMWGQIAAPALYSIGLVSTGQPRALFAAGFCATWSAMSVWRLWQITRGIRVLRTPPEATA